MSLEYEAIVCTYNGEAYIEEQLRSIIAQEPSPLAVWVSDDGSTDETENLVRQIKDNTRTPVYWIEGPKQGVAKNVLFALRRTASQYVFLADQDDIWLEGKAAAFGEKMYASDDPRSKIPHLIFSDAYVWQPQKSHNESFWKSNKINPSNANNVTHSIFYNSVQGASSCVNRSMIEHLKEDERIVIHDWWIALVAACLGTISVVEKPTLLYRQHNQNQIGSSGPVLKKAKIIRLNISKAIDQAQALQDHYSNKLNENSYNFLLDLTESYKNGGLSRLRFLAKHKIRHKTFLRTLALSGGYLFK